MVRSEQLQEKKCTYDQLKAVFIKFATGGGPTSKPGAMPRKGSIWNSFTLTSEIAVSLVEDKQVNALTVVRHNGPLELVHERGRRTGILEIRHGYDLLASPS